MFARLMIDRQPEEILDHVITGSVAQNLSQVYLTIRHQARPEHAVRRQPEPITVLAHVVRDLADKPDGTAGAREPERSSGPIGDDFRGAQGSEAGFNSVPDLL